MTSDATTDLFAVCDGAGCESRKKTKPAKAGGLKVPLGWKRIGGELLCPACVDARYYTRAIRVPIVGLYDSGRNPGDWAECRRSLTAAATEMARFANWYVQRLYAADLACAPSLERTKDGKVKLPTCPEIEDYYARATRAFPALAPTAIVAASKMVRGWYVARRFEALVELKRSVENYRWGYLPIEIPAQAWSLRETADGKLWVRTQVGPGTSWDVAILPDYPALHYLRQIMTNVAVPLGLKIVRGQRPHQGKRIDCWMFRVAARLPRQAPRGKLQEVTLTLGHDAESLLFGHVEGIDEVFEFGGATLKSIIVGGDKSERLARVESRARCEWSRRKRERWARHDGLGAQKRADKIKDQVKLAAAELARWADRQRVTSVDYDTTDRGFVPHFPWHALRQAISCALERRGIALHDVTPEPADTS